ncbi:MAG: ATP-binding cassette domain-containing protein, partial [Synergistales bacterium]|nr:ATP-binding cassette domain-containing protein [Synergistales bacterium]
AFTMAYEPMKRLAKLNNSLQMGLGASERVFSMLDERGAVNDKIGAVRLEADRALVEFEDVTFSYSGTENPALSKVSFEAKPDEVVAFVGPSGGGKSTLINLIPRFYDIDGGCIKVNGYDVRDLSLESLRGNIALGSQDITIFNDSVFDNIRYGSPDAAPEEVYRAAKAAAAHEFIKGLEDGYNTIVGENGVKLSGGQKQRIGVLRALAADPDVILMDEPFGALDPLSRDRLQTELLEMQKSVKKTIVFVTHDMDEALKMADRVILMRRGKVEQMGSPVEIQTNPVNDFVRTFLGEDRLAQITPDMGIESLVQDPYLRVQAAEKAADVLSRMEDLNLDTGQVVDDEGRWVGMIVPRRAKAMA